MNKDYIYDCETSDTIVYRNKYTGREIHISKDKVTNGDMIMAMFPSAKVNVTKYSYVVEVKLPYHTERDTGLLFNRDWWNAPYKRR